MIRTRAATLTALAAAALGGLALGAPARAGARDGTAPLLVSARVVRSIDVSVSGGGSGEAGAPPSVRIGRSSGERWSASLELAARTPGISVSSYGPDPRYLVVTVHADAAIPFIP